MPEPLSPAQIADIAAKVERAHAEICAVASEGVRHRFRMSIPANPGRDTDLIVSEALKGAEDLLAEVDRLKAELREAQKRRLAVSMLRVWKNEDGKGFVFADDLRTALDGPAAEAVSG